MSGAHSSPRRLWLPGDSSDPQGLTRLGLSFLDWLTVHGYSPATVRARCDGLRCFLRWSVEHSLVRAAEVTAETLQRYQRHLYHQPLSGRDRPMSVRTQHNRLQSLRCFFRWLARQKMLPFNPASELELPRLGQRLPRHVLSAAEVERILAQPDISSPGGVRDRAMLETLYSTGMRRAELLGLELADLELERGTALIRHGKGNKQRLVPLGRRAAAWLEKYLLEVRPALAVDPLERALFLTLLGAPPGTRWLSKRVARYIHAAGLGQIGACHLLRHSMATSMLDNGADIRFIQQMLGHEHLSTTQVYTHVSLGKLQQIHAATHPAELGRSARALKSSAPGTTRAAAGSSDADERPEPDPLS